MRDNYKLLFLLIGNLWFIAGHFSTSIVPHINGFMWLLGLAVIMWLDLRELKKKYQTIEKELNSTEQLLKELERIEKDLLKESKKDNKNAKK